MFEEELGAAIGAQLREELADVRASSGLAAAVRRRRSRQRWATGSALAVPILAGGVALALLVGGSPAGQTSPPAGARSSAADPRLRDVAYVSQKSDQALGSIDQYVVHQTFIVDGKPRQESWADGGGVRWLNKQEPAGNPPVAYLLTIEGDKLVTLWVDYQKHTWYRSTNRDMDQVPSPKGFGINNGDADALRAQLRDGTLSIVGQEKVDGRDAVHLRLNPDPIAAGKVGMDLWVDARSFLPLKETGYKMVSSLGLTYEWLPRNAENLAKLTLTVPAGFTEVDPSTQVNPSQEATPSPKG